MDDDQDAMHTICGASNVSGKRLREYYLLRAGRRQLSWPLGVNYSGRLAVWRIKDQSVVEK